MGETKTARSPIFLGTEFNAFLFEQIGADSRGRPVTVVSALARLDMDPWAEADRLSRLPGPIAARSVSMVLSRLPEIAMGATERQLSAVRLVRLLPKQLLGSQVKNPFVRADTPRLLPRAVSAGLFCAVAVFLLGQILWQSHQAALVAPQTPSAAQAVPAPRSHPGN
jgi:hypothetical protein